MPEEEYPELAYFTEERRMVEVLDRGAYVSLIAYNENGIEFEIYVDNLDLEFFEGIGYEVE